jgi:hypothetical protein
MPWRSTRASSKSFIAARDCGTILPGISPLSGTRRDVIREGLRLWSGREPYADSIEELTPVRLDWVSAILLATTAIALLVTPKLAAGAARLRRASARSQQHPADRARRLRQHALKRLIIVAVAITLRCGDVAILEIVIFDWCRDWRWRRLLRFAVVLGTFRVLAGFTHDIPLIWIGRCHARTLRSGGALTSI